MLRKYLKILVRYNIYEFQLKTNLLDRTNPEPPRTRAITQPFVVNREIVPVRELLREQHYLCFPKENQEHISVNKK